MKYIEREIEVKIRKFLGEREMIAILGVRQSGKTTLMKRLSNQLEAEGKKVNYLSFEDVGKLELFDHDIESFISLYVKLFEYLFIDEVQYATNSGQHLKLIFDSTQVKVIISGSSVIDISIKSIRYLAGRIFVFILYPFSFREFIASKDENLCSIYDQAEYGASLTSTLHAYLSEFLTYGGFPRVVMSDDPEIKKKVIEDLFNILLLRDIKDLFGLGDHYKLNQLIRLLSLQTGNQVNYSELSRSCGISLFELKSMLSILEKCFIVSRVNPWFSNKRTEIVKSPKIYFIDAGFMNYARNNITFSQFDGAIFEQFVFSELIKKNMNLRYWRSKSGAEVDFILGDKNPIPVEVKSNLDRPARTRSFTSFIDQYKSSKGYILSSGFEGSAKLAETSISYLPFVKCNVLFGL